MHEALSTTIRDVSAAEQRASWFSSKSGDREHGTGWNLSWQCAYWPTGSLLNLSPLQNRHGGDGPMPVTTPPRRNLEPRTSRGGDLFFLKRRLDLRTAACPSEL